MSETEKILTYTKHASPEADEVAKAYEMADHVSQCCIRKLLGLNEHPFATESDDEIVSSEAGINLNKICRDNGIRVFSYQGMQKSDGWPNFPLREEIDSVMRKSCGLAFATGGEHPVIVFDNRLKDSEIRYTIAHELGHILLGHLKSRADFKNEMPDYAEAEANIFAAVLTANDILCRYGQKAEI